ncbi:MAG: arginine repressor [Oscillospiraceae bacterium]|nr:arginine repressor [Oscillospiraceae bacterium]
MIKSNRQNKIIEIILSKNIDCQEDLLAELKLAGYNVTQATVSRDIKELNLTKEVAPEGGYRYALRKNAQKKEPLGNLREIMSFASLSADYAGNIVAVKCRPGMAQGICHAIDELDLSSVIATIAGDDTIFILTRSENSAQALTRQLSS